jgi:hypothetical protein
VSAKLLRTDRRCERKIRLPGATLRADLLDEALAATGDLSRARVDIALLGGLGSALGEILLDQLPLGLN